MPLPSQALAGVSLLSRSVFRTQNRNCLRLRGFCNHGSAIVPDPSRAASRRPGLSMTRTCSSGRTCYIVRDANG
jgi:hypothetical protein